MKINTRKEIKMKAKKVDKILNSSGPVGPLTPIIYSQV